MYIIVLHVLVGSWNSMENIFQPHYTHRYTLVIAEREVRQLIVQRGGRIWASATIYLPCNALECNYCGPARKLGV